MWQDSARRRVHMLSMGRLSKPVVCAYLAECAKVMRLGSVLLQEGNIAEQGVHSELVQRGGLYAEMWQRQAEAAAIEEAEAPEDPADMADDVTAPSHNASEGNLSNGHGY